MRTRAQRTAPYVRTSPRPTRYLRSREADASIPIPFPWRIVEDNPASPINGRMSLSESYEIQDSAAEEMEQFADFGTDLVEQETGQPLEQQPDEGTVVYACDYRAVPPPEMEEYPEIAIPSEVLPEECTFSSLLDLHIRDDQGNLWDFHGNEGTQWAEIQEEIRLEREKERMYEALYDWREEHPNDFQRAGEDEDE